MRLYLNILIGDRPETARSLFASADPQVVRAAVDSVVSRLRGAGDGPTPPKQPQATQVDCPRGDR
jgi:hypothetical protein